MGLDLYKYKLSKTEDTSKIIFIGKDEKEYQSLFPLIKKTELDDNYINDCINSVLKKHDIKNWNIEEAITWNFDIDNPYIIVYSTNTKKL